MESLHSELNCILRMSHCFSKSEAEDLLIRQPSMWDNICLKKGHSHLQKSETIMFLLDNLKDSCKLKVNNLQMINKLQSDSYQVYL